MTMSDVARINRLYRCTQYYLGDDLPGAIPYHQWNATTTCPNPNLYLAEDQMGQAIATPEIA